MLVSGAIGVAAGRATGELYQWSEMDSERSIHVKRLGDLSYPAIAGGVAIIAAAAFRGLKDDNRAYLHAFGIGALAADQAIVGYTTSTQKA